MPAGKKKKKKIGRSGTSILQEQMTTKTTIKMGYSWLHRMASPMRRAWAFFTFSKIRRNKDGGPGLWKLSSEVRSCSYEDVHVMWSILHKSQTFKAAPKKSRFSRMHQVA